MLRERTAICLPGPQVACPGDACSSFAWTNDERHFPTVACCDLERRPLCAHDRTLRRWADRSVGKAAREDAPLRVPGDHREGNGARHLAEVEPAVDPERLLAPPRNPPDLHRLRPRRRETADQRDPAAREPCGQELLRSC